ncbi:MAG: OmpA family protein [Nitrospira sp.]|nr:OmpA family protein [Nitrospira sp.]
MQNGPSQVSSGHIAPKIVGPQRDAKEVTLLAGAVLVLGGFMAAAWYYGQAADQITVTPATEKVENSGVSEIIKKASAMNLAEAATITSTSVTAPTVAPLEDVIHADVYFEVGRKGLTEEGKAQLAARAELLKHNQDYGILILGYTDQQGSADYNKKLGFKRAETVKTEFLHAGVAENRMKVVSLGEEGVLCVDGSALCRTINRRVHLETRKIGQDHMAVPAVAAGSSDLSDTSTDSSTKTEETGPSTDNLLPLISEPASGS